MSRPPRAYPQVPVLGPAIGPAFAAVLAAVLALVLSGCLSPMGNGGAGLVTQHRMGQGSTRCATSPPTTAATVRVALMDMRRGHRSTSGMGGRMAGTGGTMRSPMMNGPMMLAVLPHIVTAGQVTFVATNRGARTHELVVLPLGAHARAGQRSVGADRAVNESAALGEASRACGADAGSGLSPGSTGWTTLTLTPGRYELVCNRPGHYARGMYAELDVVG